ncbi:DUF1292 domain-containing protein [Tissierella sp. Yu-01]|uniref:DUF1292 domain-containing protein n=1 Tax=Tissierella sp. Yu-01 TaxID=3035694 RepID=UPI00240D4D91|nr:DUF1292 domain-containing protein [Tissierella sp. Yu-01]WFA09391.1 DUF1292 domain-containing protein [Tissierella sp. Yu-01]
MNDKHVHDENCNHDHEDMDIIYLTLEDDSELECEVIGIFEVEDKSYIALIPIGDEEVLLYGYKELENEEFDLLSIEDEEEFELVSEAFYALYSDDDFEEFEDDEEYEEE